MGENNTELIIYQTEDGKTKIDVHMENETVWLSLDQMAELFQRDKSTISKHIKNIFAEGELTREAVVANFATTATDGKTYQVDHYNLDVIICWLPCEISAWHPVPHLGEYDSKRVYDQGIRHE